MIAHVSYGVTPGPLNRKGELMAGPCCDNCVYSVCDPELAKRRLWLGEPVVPRCANHPFWPGRLHDVPGVPCRNYRRKPTLPTGDVRMIPLGDGFYAYVDAADYEWLSQWTWHMHSGGYAGRSEKGKTILMHRQIMQPPEGRLVDHADGNKANNCRSNLRFCTGPENQRSRRKARGCVSKYKGVFYDKRCNKWFAKYRCNGKYHSLGYFDLEVDAARAYDRAAVLHYGQFARPNFPEEWPPERRTQLDAERAAVGKEGKKVGGKENKCPQAKKGRRKTKVTRAEGKKEDP
jgi:hypothetical protein